MDLATVDELLTSTRSVRKRLDLSRPVEPKVIERCIEIALQAPTASNAQSWHFVVVTDPEKRGGIAQLYRQAWAGYDARRGRVAPNLAADDPRATRMQPVRNSAAYLAEHMHQVPVLIIPCIDGRVENAGVAAQASLYGSILPATWSLMLALRARGLGAAWTTLHLIHEKQVAELLAIPENVTQAALLPVAYFTGADFKPAARVPATERTYWNAWGVQRADARLD